MKIYIIQKSGVYDYEQFAIIEYITTDFEEAKNEYEKMKKTEFEHFKKYDNTREWSYNENKDNTMIEFYLDGYSMDDSSKIEIVEKVLDTEKYIEFEETELIDRYKDYIKDIEPNSNVTYKEFANAYISSVIIEDKHIKLKKDRVTKLCKNCGKMTEIDKNGGYCEHCNNWIDI